MTSRDDFSMDMSGAEGIGAADDPEPRVADTAAVTRFLAELRSLGADRAPAPTSELEAVFAGATPMSGRRRRYGGAVRRIALVAALAVAGFVVAAANHALPAPAQRVVSNVVKTVTPFHIDGQSGPPPVVPHRLKDERAPTHGAREATTDESSDSTGRLTGSGATDGGARRHGDTGESAAEEAESGMRDGDRSARYRAEGGGHAD